MADGPIFQAPPLLDYRGATDDRVWITRESVLEEKLAAAEAERDLLREIVRGLIANLPKSQDAP
jgi:hypothetical protein